METITNAATAASKLVFGTPQTNETGGKEPVSGEQGAGTIDEPYDQGNNPVDPTTTHDTTSTSAPSFSDNTSAQSNSAFSGKPSDTFMDYSSTTGKSGSTDPTSTLGNEPSMTDRTKSSTDNQPTSTSGTDSALTSKPPIDTTATIGGVPRPEHETDKTGVVGSMGNDPKGKDVIPSESTAPGAAPDSGANFALKHQGADAPSSAPTGAETDAVKGTKNEGEAALAKKDPNDHSGEPLKMHGTDGSVGKTQEERRESKVGNPGGQEHGKEEGTGEKWVKSSGLAAEGGDFDATKPGAGREADRILESKGVHKDAKGAMEGGAPETESSHNGGKEKVSKIEKIKEKLHIGHKDK